MGNSSSVKNGDVKGDVKQQFSKKNLLSILMNYKGDLSQQNRSFSGCTLISPNDEDLKEIDRILVEFEKKPEDPVSRALATFICSALGDSLGCNTEFSHFKYNKHSNLLLKFST